MFFHPGTGHFVGNYPFSHDYIDLIARYVLYDQVWNIGKAMANQHDASGQQIVFVFPVGGSTQSFGSFGSQSGALRILQEVNYFIQRMQNVPFPLQPLGNVAISGFSAGIRTVSSILGSGRVAQFYDKLLKEVYSFDGTFVIRDKVTKKDILDVVSTTNCINQIKGWLRGGADKRKVRVYTQGQIWLDQLKGSITSPTTINGPDGSTEIHGDNGTILHTPSAMWKSVDPDIRRVAVDLSNIYKSVHQFIPAMFIQHAIKTCTLR